MHTLLRQGELLPIVVEYALILPGIKGHLAIPSPLPSLGSTTKWA